MLASLLAAQANALAQRGALFPVIGASFDVSRQQTPLETLTSNVPSGASIYSLHTPQVTVAFVPDIFGGTRRAIEAAEAQAEQQAFQREAVYVTLASNVALAAIQEASLRGQIAATRRLIEIQTQLLDILKRQRDWQDGQAKKRLLAAFATLDDAGLVSSYRRKMASLVF